MDAENSLCHFFTAIKNDGRISITHIGVYAALIKYRLDHGNMNPIYVFSREILVLAKLSDSDTYLKCVRDLSEYGYINYEPSFKRTKGSCIYFVEKEVENRDS